MDVGLSKLREIVKDREASYAAVHGVAKSRTWLSNWTTTNDPRGSCSAGLSHVCGRHWLQGPWVNLVGWLSELGFLFLTQSLQTWRPVRALQFITVLFVKSWLCVLHYGKCFAFIISFSPHNSPVRKVVITPLTNEGNWDLERWYCSQGHTSSEREV